MPPSRCQVSDAKLIADADPAAFAELFDRHAAALLGWARRSGVSNADAVELVAETFARAWISRRRFRDPGDGGAAPWLFGIARNVLAASRRRAAIDARARIRLGMQVGPPGDERDEVVARLDAATRLGDVEQVLAELPDRHREAVRMRVVEGRDYADIAHALRCSDTTARKWVSLGLGTLRQQMGDAR
jgi:RNA polymerase sigma-70 factor (ECF subfamily)